ncbi:NAD-dependent epimerase/dehydratase family protein [Sphingomonas sp. GCM10030256]|uniref:NAD-dependent epimerase/dehydratase family protein n=1 Tax=Sphingomonas sp. GCM10030256 TaxID=3273427 RepID=UPI00360D938A
MTAWTFNEDLAGMSEALTGSWPQLAGKRLFMTGGTGFIGRWMLEALREADRRMGLGVTVDILTRNPAAFAAKAPHLVNHPGFNFIAGDVLSLRANGERYDYVLHAATDASADLNENDPLRMFDTIVAGTRAALDLAVRSKAKRFFFFSSGAIYGAQPWEVTHVAEDYRGAPDLGTHRSAYAEGKRAAEMLCTIYARQQGLNIVNARIFALLGPLLSLDIHFAAGNFIRDAMAGRKVVVQGAGTAVRSYLYAADLTVWLWKILLEAPPGGTYNVGSEDGISIAELARRTATLLGDAGFEILGREDSGWNPGRYVPSTRKIQDELGVAPTVGLDEAIVRTARWNGWNG